MRSRKSSNQHAAEVARQRLELLSAELAEIRPDPVDPPSRLGRDGSGEPSNDVPADVSAAVPPDAPAPVERPGRHAFRPTEQGSALGGWVEDRLPAGLQGRVRIGAAHLAAVAVLVAAAMALLAWSTVRADDPGALVPRRATTGPVSDAEPLVTPVGAPVPEGSAATSAGASPGAAEVVVDVAGKVRRPGIVRLPAGSRVVDAVEAAGGPRRGVDLSSLNLARILVDGEQVVVGMPAPQGVAASAASAPAGAPGAPGTLVNVNTADQATLETLPGIGPVTAAAIVQWRTDNGTFSAVDELMEVSGIGEATLADIAPYVTV